MEYALFSEMFTPVCTVRSATYEIGAVIGKGNDGQVVRAVNIETEKCVAIKIMKRKVNLDDGMSEVLSHIIIPHVFVTSFIAGGLYEEGAE